MQKFYKSINEFWFRHYFFISIRFAINFIDKTKRIWWSFIILFNNGVQKPSSRTLLGFCFRFSRDLGVFKPALSCFLRSIFYFLHFMPLYILLTKLSKGLTAFVHFESAGFKFVSDIFHLQKFPESLPRDPESESIQVQSNRWEQMKKLVKQKVAIFTLWNVSST